MNVLLLEKGCQHCAVIKVSCDLNKLEDDSFVPRNGEKILLFFSSSSDGTLAFTKRFEFTQVAPILKTSTGKELTNVDEILEFLGCAGYLKP